MASSVAPGQVVGRSGGGLADDQVLRGPATQPDGQRVEEVALGVEVALVDRELFGDPERPAGGQDGDLGHRIGVLREESDQGMARLVDRHRVLLLGQEGVGGVSAAQDDPVPGFVDVLGVDDLPIVPHGDDGRLVDEIGQVGPGEPRRGPGHGVEVDVLARCLPSTCTARMAGPFGLVGQRDLHLPIEAARAEQGGIEHLGAVGGGHDHHPGGRDRSRPSRPAAG